MTDKRWLELMADNGSELTQEEIKKGWHWCPEFDGLLVNFYDKKSEGQFCGRACKPDSKL